METVEHARVEEMKRAIKRVVTADLEEPRAAEVQVNSAEDLVAAEDLVDLAAGEAELAGGEADLAGARADLAGAPVLPIELWWKNSI